MYNKMVSFTQNYRMNKEAFSVGSLGDDREERDYWHSRTPAERLAALEYMRQVAYGYDPAVTRLQRVLEVVERSDIQRSHHGNKKITENTNGSDT
jgi:hypothetical protein